MSKHNRPHRPHREYNAELVSSYGHVYYETHGPVQVWAEFRNTGTKMWDANTRLATIDARDRVSRLYADTWLSPGRVCTVDRAVHPGETYIFRFTINIPNDLPDYFSENFGFVQEGLMWFERPTANISLHLMKAKTVKPNEATENNIVNAQSSPDSSTYGNQNKICILSTWNIKCGISQYSRNVYDALIAQKYEVNVIPHTVEYNDVFNIITKLNYNIFIVQYEQGIIKSIEGLLECVRKLKHTNPKIKVYFIIHSESNHLQKFDGIIDGFIYHKNPKIPLSRSKTSIIPMGVPTFTPTGDKKFYRDKYNINEHKFVISTVGFMFRWKQHAIFLDKIAPHLRGRDDAVIQLLTSFHSINNSECVSECEAIKTIINKHKLHDKVIHITDFISQEELNERLFLSDLGFLWSGIETTSSSASLKEFVSSRLPLVKTNSNHHHDVNVGCVVTDKNMDHFVNKIVGMYNNKESLDTMRSQLEIFYNEHNYNKIILKMLEIING